MVEISAATLRKQFNDYVGVKSDEIKEQREARHYYHGDQWKPEEIAVLNQRKQPVVFWNRIARKIDGVVGLLGRFRQDPKAYPRTPNEAEGAEIATATLRYTFDSTDWPSKSAECARHGATEGISGLALALVAGDQGDPEIDLEEVDNDSFFYDPRSFRADFSDARFMGIYRWIDEDDALEMFPGKEAEIEGLLSSGGGSVDTDADQDRATKWVNSSSKRLRVVEHWYRKGRQWRYAFWTADTILMEGDSPFFDEKGASISRFVMFSAVVDHDGDRYGFVRNLKSAQDEVNHRRSTALYESRGRRILTPKGAFEDIEAARREAVRPDGVIEYEMVGADAPKFDDARSAEVLRTQLELMAEAKNEIDNFSFNPSLVGTGVKDMSGRAISLQQQAGIAELGPFMEAYRNWKIRMYRAVWCAIQRYWTAERWIRVTDDEGVAQFIQANGVGLDPQTGQPVMVNALGALDVDIILDEGPDTVNMQQDAFEALTSMGPAVAQQFPELIIELLPVDERIKKQMREKIQAANQPNPAAEQMQQIQLAGEAAKVEKTQSEVARNMAQAQAAMTPEPQQMSIQAPEGQKPPSKSINFKDIPPEAQSQMLAQGGIYVAPETIAADQAEKAVQQAALRAMQRSSAPTTQG